MQSARKQLFRIKPRFNMRRNVFRNFLFGEIREKFNVKKRAVLVRNIRRNGKNRITRNAVFGKNNVSPRFAKRLSVADCRNDAIGADTF